MKKITFLLLAGLIGLSGAAQVHVKNNAFIYSKGTDIFITKELQLHDAQSAFYLREGADEVDGDGNGQIAQLIQEDPTSTNEGLGYLSVFQEGLADNYTYNYWSSPVSLPSASTGNSGFSYNQIYFPKLMETFQYETDYVIDAQQATFLSPSIRDGSTDVQAFTTDEMTSNPKDPVVTSPLRIAKRWLYSYKSADPDDSGNVTGGGYFGWKSFQADGDVVKPGYGFTMKGQSGNGVNIIPSSKGNGQRYDFRGSANNGTFQVSVKNDDFSLVGNPYPSALDLKQFMDDNQGLIDGELFFWDSASTTHILVEYEGGYGTYSPQLGDPSSDGYYVDAVFKKYDSQGVVIDGSETGGSGGLSTPVGDPNQISRRYAAIGQGFVIQRTDDGSLPHTSINTIGTVEFKNSQRAFFKENGDESFFKAAPGSSNDQTSDQNAAAVTPAMSLEIIINTQYSREMIVSFSPNSTADWDWGMDASNSANRVSNDAYMLVNGKQALIQAIPFNASETILPIGLKSNAATSTFTFKVTGRQNFSPEQVLVYDKLTDSYHDILNDSYTVQVEKGTTQDRFEIVFEEKSTLSNGTDVAVENFTIFQNNDDRLLTVRNPNNQQVADISVYDLAGRLVAQLSPKDVKGEYTFNTSTYAVGIYVVKVTTNNEEEMAKKVIISN